MDGSPPPPGDWIREPEICVGLVLLLMTLARPRNRALSRLLARAVPLCLWTAIIRDLLPTGESVLAWMQPLSEAHEPILYTHRHSLQLLLVICGLPLSLLAGEILVHLLGRHFPPDPEEISVTRSPWLHWILADAKNRMNPADYLTGWYSIGHMRWSPFGALIQLALAIFVETALILSTNRLPCWRILGAPPEQQKLVFVLLFATFILSCARAPLPVVWILSVWAVGFFHASYFPEAVSPALLILVISITTLLGIKELVTRGRESLILVGRDKAYRYFIPLTGPPRFEGSGLLDGRWIEPDHRYQRLDGKPGPPPLPIPAASWGHGLVAFGAVSALLVCDHYTRLDRAINNVINVSCSFGALERGLLERAEVLAATALSSDPKNTMALGVIAEVRCQQGRHDEAREWAARALRWKEHDWSTCRSVERIARLVEDHQRLATEMTEMTEEEAPAAAGDHARRLLESPAETFSATTHAAREALPWARLAVRTDPLDAGARYALALAASRLARALHESERAPRFGQAPLDRSAAWLGREAREALDGVDESEAGTPGYQLACLEVAGALRDTAWIEELVASGALDAAAGPMTESRRLILSGLVQAGKHEEARRLLATLDPPPGDEAASRCLTRALEDARRWMASLLPGAAGKP